MNAKLRSDLVELIRSYWDDVDEWANWPNYRMIGTVGAAKEHIRDLLDEIDRLRLEAEGLRWRTDAEVLAEITDPPGEFPEGSI